jgi:hypothetical protein
VSVALPPATSEGIVHETAPVPPTEGVLQVNPAPEAETNVVLAGMVSVSVIDDASLGPAFETTIV